MCEESHDALKTLYVVCPFCEMTLREITKVTLTCCNNPMIFVDEFVRRCMNCYWFEYQYVRDFKCGYRTLRKSVYVRKYQFMKTINKYMCGVLLMDEKLMLYEVFVVLQSYIIRTKRSVKFAYLIRKIFELKGDIAYKNLPLPKSKMTLLKYEDMICSALTRLTENELFINFERRN